VKKAPKPRRVPDFANYKLPITNSQSAKPLAGKRVIVSRARAQAGVLSAQLRALGAQILEIPFIAIRKPRTFKPLDDALRQHTRYEWLVLTSVNGVAALFERAAKLGIEAQEFNHLKIAAIGPATRKAIESYGVQVHVVPEKYVAESVVARLKSRVAGKRVLLVRAKVARDVIPRELRAAGARVDVREAYETVVPRTSQKRLLAALKSAPRRPDVITFTSSSTARNFLDLIGGKVAYSGLLDGVNLASIGPITTAALRECNLPVSIRAREYTIPGLVSAIVEHFKTHHRDTETQRKPGTRNSGS
jgi:uroporphyrinogen-III synthase